MTRSVLASYSPVDSLRSSVPDPALAVANCLGHEAELDRTLNLQVRTRHIVASVDVPVMADGEDGYGGPDKIGETIAAFIDAGVAGINIEDQIIGAGEVWRSSNKP